MGGMMLMKQKKIQVKKRFLKKIKKILPIGDMLN